MTCRATELTDPAVDNQPVATVENHATAAQNGGHMGHVAIDVDEPGARKGASLCSEDAGAAGGRSWVDVVLGPLTTSRRDAGGKQSPNSNTSA